MSDDDVFYHISMIMNVDPAEIAKIVHDYIERDIGNGYDRLNCPKPPIYIGPVKVKSLKEKIDNYKRRKKEMKATSVQNIKNVKDICFSIENHPAEIESKLIIVASTDDDIFAFEFEGMDLLQSCKRADLFTGWEKDQKIRELEAKGKNISDDNALLLETNKKLREEIKKLEHNDMLDKEVADYWLKEHDTLSERFSKLQEENEKLKKELSLERAANEAHHNFFKQYAGKGTEIEFDRAIGDTDEVTYVIVDKERYQTLKDRGCNVVIHGKDFTPMQLVDRIFELERLKTPTIENFADEEPSSRRDILRCAEKCVCGQREQDYGTPESNFQLIADLWNDYLKKERSSIVVDAMDVSMMMALLKIARIRNGGGSGDSFVDLAGYAACGGEIWADEKKNKDQK